MREANSGYLKIYLYILYTVQSGRDVDPKEGARALDIFESEFEYGVKYWLSKGAFSHTDSGFVINMGADSAEDAEYQPEIREEAAPVIPRSEEVPVISEPKGYDITRVTEAMNSNTELSNMITLAGEILGRTLNQDAMKTLYWFYDYLKMPVEVILMLLEFCRGINKTHIKYIEATAVSWKQNGIDTAEKADEYMREAAQKNKKVYSVKKALGISDRALSPSETDYINTWLNSVGIEEDLIVLAYDYCVMSTGKLSFKYMNKIIMNWSEKGIFSVKAAKLDYEQHKKESEEREKKRAEAEANKKADPRLERKGELYEDGYDHAALEKAMWDKFE